MSTTNTVPVTPFLRNTLLLDGLVSGAAGVAMLGGAGLIAPLTVLPPALLAWSGGLLLPWCAALVALSRRSTLPRLWLIDVIAINALWVAASFGLLVSGMIAPNWLGVGFVAMQAMMVVLFAELQVVALRRVPSVAA